MTNPSKILELATAYWASMVLLAANRLEIFTHLAEEPLTAREAAARCKASPRSMEMLLNACVAHGFLDKGEGVYANTDLARAFLVKGGPAYLGDGLSYSLDLYPVWGQLAEAVRAGVPPIGSRTILGADPEKTRNFVMGMHNRALGVARSLADALDLAGRRPLLDVGGGPGTYSILLVDKTPGLRATVLDLPGILEVSREIIAGFPVADRIETLAGDYNELDFAPGHDVVLMSGMMHRETPQSCQRLLAKAFGALEAGGLVVISDVFFDDEEKTSPLFTTLFALNMMLTSDHGSAHALSEMEAWTAQAGFTEVERKPFPPPMPHSMVLAVRP